MSVRIVAIETTSEHGSLALIEDGNTVAEIELVAPDGFGQVLFPALSDLMQRHDWTYDSVSGYAAGAGPGSFTGVRVGLAAVKGLAEATGVKAAAVSNFKAMATFGTSATRACFYDARRNEVYAGVYDASLALVQEEIVSPFDAWLAALPGGDVELLTPDPSHFAEFTSRWKVTQTPRTLAAAIGRLAIHELQDPAAIDANYVRRSDAELHWREL